MNASLTTSELPHRFVLYVPTDRRGGMALCSILELILCDRLGGVTSYPARGTFKMNRGKRVSESIQVLESYCESAEWPRQHPYLMKLCAVVAGLLEQQAIACAIDGRMETVAPISIDPAPHVAQGSSSEKEAWLNTLIERQLHRE